MCIEPFRPRPGQRKGTQQQSTEHQQLHTDRHLRPTCTTKCLEVLLLANSTVFTGYAAHRQHLGLIIDQLCSNQVNVVAIRGGLSGRGGATKCIFIAENPQRELLAGDLEI